MLGLRNVMYFSSERHMKRLLDSVFILERGQNHQDWFHHRNLTDTMFALNEGKLNYVKIKRK